MYLSKEQNPNDVGKSVRTLWEMSQILGSDKPNYAEPYLSYWDGSYSGDSEPIDTEKVDVKISSHKENEDSESSFYIKIFFPVPLIILLYFLIKSCIKRRTQIELHKARCRGELPGGVPGMPFGTVIGEDGLPREIDSKYAWGNRYTFYISQKGEVFHSNPWCSKGTLIAVHAIYLGRRRPCKKCRPVKPDLSWFIPYFQKWKENTGKTKSLEAKKGESCKPKTIIRESKSKTYSKVIQTGVDENGNKIWTAFFADTPEELRQKTDEREYKGE